MPHINRLFDIKTNDAARLITEMLEIHERLDLGAVQFVRGEHPIWGHVVIVRADESQSVVIQI